MQDFTQMAVMAYECGLSEDTLLLELRHLKGDVFDPKQDAEVTKAYPQFSNTQSSMYAGGHVCVGF